MGASSARAELRTVAPKLHSNAISCVRFNLQGYFTGKLLVRVGVNHGEKQPRNAASRGAVVA